MQAFWGIYQKPHQSFTSISKKTKKTSHIHCCLTFSLSRTKACQNMPSQRCGFRLPGKSIKTSNFPVGFPSWIELKIKSLWLAHILMNKLSVFSRRDLKLMRLRGQLCHIEASYTSNLADWKDANTQKTDWRSPQKKVITDQRIMFGVLWSKVTE